MATKSPKSAKQQQTVSTKPKNKTKNQPAQSFEEDGKASPEFLVDSDVANPQIQTENKDGGTNTLLLNEIDVLTAGRLSNGEIQELMRHTIHIDQVFELVAVELTKTLGTQSTSGPSNIFSQNELGMEQLLVLCACEKLYEQGAMPSDQDFQPRLQAEANTLAQKSYFKDELFEGDAATYINNLKAHNTCLDPKEGIALLQRQLYRHRFYRGVGEILLDGIAGKHPADILSQAHTFLNDLQDINSISTPAGVMLGKELDDFLDWLSTKRGQALVGLKTGFDQIDNRTCGLRGTMLLGAPPGAGKTNLVAEIAVGVCQHHKVNDAVVVILSLDMPRRDLYTRILSNLTELDWRVLRLGDSSGEKDGLSAESRARLKKGKKLLHEKQLDVRLQILDRTIVGDRVTARQIIALVEKAKKHADASKALVIVDYLQLLDAAELTGTEADSFRLRVLQQIAEADEGHTVLAISETRKPASNKEQWGLTVADLMGSARLSYGVDAVFLLQPMTWPEVVECYGLKASQRSAKGVASFVQELSEKGRTPVALRLEKGRDGMHRGSMYFEFQYRVSRMAPLSKKLDMKKLAAAEGKTKSIEKAIATKGLNPPKAKSAVKQASESS